MTEAEWHACKGGVCALLPKAKKMSVRKQQLIAVATCKLIHYLPRYEVYHQAVLSLEKFAEGLSSDAAHEASREAVYRTPENRNDFVEQHVRLAVCYAIYPIMRNCVGGVIGAINSAAQYLVWSNSSGAENLAGRNQGHAGREAVRLAVWGVFQEIMGNPFRPYLAVPSWQGGGVTQPDGRTVLFTDAVKGIADAVHVTGDFGRLPILADALEEAGVTDEVLLSHCRDGGPHLRGCWALDVVRGRS